MTEEARERDGLDPDGHRLLQLFRAMHAAERGELLTFAAQLLMRRCSIDPHLHRYSDPAKALQEELREQSLEDRVLKAWPADRPGREIVELDNFGDPGWVLHKLVEEGNAEAIIGAPDDDEQWAELLTEKYLAAHEDQYFPLPDEFGMPYDEMIEAIRKEFLAFFRAWREGIVSLLEERGRTAE